MWIRLNTFLSVWRTKNLCRNDIRSWVQDTSFSRKSKTFWIWLSSFLSVWFRLHVQRNECYVHIMTRSGHVSYSQKCWYRPTISWSTGVSKNVKKCVTRMRKVEERRKEKGGRKIVVTQRCLVDSTRFDLRVKCFTDLLPHGISTYAVSAKHKKLYILNRKKNFFNHRTLIINDKTRLIIWIFT